ncbi:hypothetical protein [Methylosinus sporium]|uniref:hypothetical protein n=1 Tax=Methylosinus sporium TaxID=428 RepID=UPI0011B260BC|nr:hypothetical protein [Methylosinus sporium]
MHHVPVWRMLALGLVALFLALPPIIAIGADVRAHAGADGGIAIALGKACKVDNDNGRASGRQDHSQSCRLCLGLSCAGDGLLPDVGAGAPVSIGAQSSHVAGRISRIVTALGASGWGSSWTAQAPPAFG